MAKKKIDFETYMQQLEEIVSRIESGEETLENSVSLYEKGIEISTICEEILDTAKQKITIIDDKKIRESKI